MSIEAKTYPANPILPIINLRSHDQAIEAAKLAEEEQVGGVFLVDPKPNTRWDMDVLAEAAEEVMVECPDLWVGVYGQAGDAVANLQTFGEELAVDGLWLSNPLGWDIRQKPTRAKLENFDAYGMMLDRYRAEGPVFFAGAAINGEGYIDDPYEAAAFFEYTQRYFDVATTGPPSALRRLQQIRLALDIGGKLAVAGSVTPEIAAECLRYADFLLPSTSVESEPWSGQLDRTKLRRLVYAYRDFLDEEIRLVEAS